MNLNEYYLIRKNIIKKLYAHNSFRNSHLVFERLKSGIPKHLSGFVGEILSDLIKDQLVLFYGKTKHGNAYQLNIDKLDEIKKIIFEN